MTTEILIVAFLGKLRISAKEEKAHAAFLMVASALAGKTCRGFENRSLMFWTNVNAVATTSIAPARTTMTIPFKKSPTARMRDSVHQPLHAPTVR